MPRLYEFTGPGGMKITYRDGSFLRLKGPELSYIDPQRNQIFGANGLTIQETIIGTLVSIVRDPELGSNDGDQFTLVIPAAVPAATIDTIGVITTYSPLRFPDPEGQDQFNSVVDLTGRVTALVEPPG